MKIISYVAPHYKAIKLLRVNSGMHLFKRAFKTFEGNIQIYVTAVFSFLIFFFEFRSVQNHLFYIIGIVFVWVIMTEFNLFNRVIKIMTFLINGIIFSKITVNI
jgi:hypothetical protein